MGFTFLFVLGFTKGVSLGHGFMCLYLIKKDFAESHLASSQVPFLMDRYVFTRICQIKD